ncbi:MAG: hypothetical protein ACC660_01250 [Acidimicrobiales bacterium]
MTAEWPADLTHVCSRLAGRLADQGATHPVAAALVLCARGQTTLDQQDFADRFELSLATVVAAEAGAVAWKDLPDIIGELLQRAPAIDLLALADLDLGMRGGAQPPPAA